MKIERRVQDFIRSQQLFADDARILVALSGGADSVALLHILVRLGYRCHAVHCNFHLRGEESDSDELFVLELCQAMHIPCQVLHFNTKEYATEHHMSIETAARELRYREFERICHEEHMDAIAVGHHQDDAVETFLLNLIRGAGINGLTGIHVSNGYVKRPLLCVTRNEITEYLDRLQQPYVTDSTNLTDEYARNKVRLKLIPLMQQINPAAKNNIFQAAMHLSEAASIYNKVILEEKEHLTEGKEEPNISIPTLLKTDAPKTHLFEILYPYGFNSAQVADIYRSLSSEAGRVFHSAHYTVLRDRTHLLIRRKEETTAGGDTQYDLPYEGTIVLPDGTAITLSHLTPEEGWQVPRRNDAVYIDAERLHAPLTIRHPKEADRFTPFGMRGTKLLSDFYTDIKLPRTEKARQWLVCHADDIVWAVGLRSSEHYRISGTEKHIICIEIDKTRNNKEP